MKYYFGRVPPRDVDTFGNDGLFENDGEFYYNSLEIGTNPGGMEDFMLSDSVGRQVPISVDHIEALITALTDIQETLEVIEAGAQALESIYEDDEIRTFEW